MTTHEVLDEEHADKQSAPNKKRPKLTRTVRV